MFFDETNQFDKLLSYMPMGKAYKHIRKQGSNFNLFMEWVASLFEDLVKRYNEEFRAMYITESDKYLQEFLDVYDIPVNEFYKQENVKRRILFIYKYLMQDNKPWNFEAIGLLLGIRVRVSQDDYETAGHDNTRKFKIPHKIPHILRDKKVFTKHVIQVDYARVSDRSYFDYKFDFKFEDYVPALEIMKIIFDLIKPAHCTISYHPKDNFNFIPTFKFDRDVLLNYLKGV